MLQFARECGRRPKGDGLEVPVPFQPEEEMEENEDEETEENMDEEIDFDNPTFKRGQIWSDYAEDLDYDQ